MFRPSPNHLHDGPINLTALVGLVVLVPYDFVV